MSAEAQTSSSTEVGSEPPAVAEVNSKKKTNANNNNNNNNARSTTAERGNNNNNNNNNARSTTAERGNNNNNNNNNARSTTAERGNNNNNNTSSTVAVNGNTNNKNNGKNGKNPVLEKITESLSSLEGSLGGSDCTSIQGKAKQVIENADPVLEAIAKQELRENNSQLSEVKGKVRSITNSIRKKCPKGAVANAPVNSGQTAQVNRVNGSPMPRENEKKQKPSLPEVGSQWTIEIKHKKHVNGPHGPIVHDGVIEGTVQKADGESVTLKVTSSEQKERLSDDPIYEVEPVPKVGEIITYDKYKWKGLQKTPKPTQGGGRRKRKTRKQKRKPKSKSRKH